MSPLINDRFLLCLAWIVYLAVIIASGGLGSYLASWQHGLVFAATMAFALLMVGAWWGTAAVPQENHRREEQKPFDQLIQTLVHCLPLFLISGLGITSLGGHALNLSTIMAPENIPTTEAPLDPASGNQPLANLTAKDLSLRDLTIADVYTKNLKLLGEMTVIGMLYRPNDADYERLPGSLTRAAVPLLLYRYQITCCAADATPIFLALLGFDPQKYPNDTWVRVTGRITPPQPPNNIGTIQATEVITVSPPSEQYLSRPLY